MPAKFLSHRTIHEGWCKLHLATFRSPGGEEFTREMEEHGDAVSVLPYDPRRRTVLLVRLLRAPVLYASGEEQLLEAPAGMIDPGETAEATARREAEEEVGVRLSGLEPVAIAWSSPGISTERLSLFLAPYDGQDRVGKGGGVGSEHEDIEVVEMTADKAWSLLCGSGEAVDLKTLLLLMALKDRRPELFGGIHT